MVDIALLSDIRPGQRARVRELRAEGGMRRRMLDIGLVENTDVECVGLSPGGDPYAFLIRGAVIAIRSADCRDVVVTMMPDNVAEHSQHTAPRAMRWEG